MDSVYRTGMEVQLQLANMVNSSTGARMVHDYNSAKCRDCIRMLAKAEKYSTLKVTQDCNLIAVL